MIIAIGSGEANALLLGLTDNELSRIIAGGSLMQVMPEGSPVKYLMLLGGGTNDELNARMQDAGRKAGKEIVVDQVTIDREGRPIVGASRG